MVVVCENDHSRANDEASHAREQLQRTFGFAEGSGAVFVPQDEAYENWEGHMKFNDSALAFLIGGECSCLSISRLSRSRRDWHARSPDLPQGRSRLVFGSDGEVG